MRTEVFISKEWDRLTDGTKLGKPFYCVYTSDDNKFVDIVAGTKSETIKIIRENKEYVWRGGYAIF